MLVAEKAVSVFARGERHQVTRAQWEEEKGSISFRWNYPDQVQRYFSDRFMPKHSSNTRYAVLRYDTYPTSELHHPLRARVELQVLIIVYLSPRIASVQRYYVTIALFAHASWSKGKGGPAAYSERSSLPSASVVVLVVISLRL